MVEYPNTYRVSIEDVQSAQIGQNFVYLFFRINKSVRNAALTEWFSRQNF